MKVKTVFENFKELPFEDKQSFLQIVDNYMRRVSRKIFEDLRKDSITLLYHGIYKDGGSKSYKDSKGNYYWLNNKFRENANKGLLFLGNINDKNPKLAKGIFYLNDEKRKILQ